MSASFSIFVPFIASHFPTSPFVPFGFLMFIPPSLRSSRSFPLHLPFGPFLFPSHFPLLSCHFHFVSSACPCISLCFLRFISLHFLAFPLRSPVFFSKKHVSSFSISRRGIRAWDPCFAPPRKQRLVVLKPYVSDVGRGYKGGLSPILS